MDKNEINDLESCRGCGIVVDVFIINKRETEDKYDGIDFLWNCPVCKEENCRNYGKI